MNAWSVDFLSKEKKAKKKNGTVPAAETKPPKNEKVEETVEVAPTSPQPPTVTVEPPKPLIEVKPELVAMAKRMGIPLDQIIDYAQNQEMRINRLENAIETLGVKLEPLFILSDRIKQAQAQNTTQTAAGTPTPSGNVLSSIAQVLPYILSGGGGENPMQKRLMDLAMKSMEANIDFSNAVKGAVVANLTSKAVKEI